MREQIENNQNYNFNGIPEYAKELEGTTIYTSNVGDNMRLITDSIEAAKSYEWLYHCTNSKAFLSILKNREFWFSNLNNVNDKDEVARIDDKAYEKAFYIGSFTYNNNIPDEHWKEYANENGVLIGVKKHWFKRHAVFMNTKNDKELSDRFFKIYNNQSTYK